MVRIISKTKIALVIGAFCASFLAISPAFAISLNKNLIYSDNWCGDVYLTEVTGFYDDSEPVYTFLYNKNTGQRYIANVMSFWTINDPNDHLWCQSLPNLADMGQWGGYGLVELQNIAPPCDTSNWITVNNPNCAPYIVGRFDFVLYDNIKFADVDGAGFTPSQIGDVSANIFTGGLPIAVIVAGIALGLMLLNWAVSKFSNNEKQKK